MKSLRVSTLRKSRFLQIRIGCQCLLSNLRRLRRLLDSTTELVDNVIVELQAVLGTGREDEEPQHINVDSSNMRLA